MSKNLGFGGEAQGALPVYEAPEHIARVVIAAKAGGSSRFGTRDANSQYYWSSDGDEVLGGTDYEVPETVAPEVPAEQAEGSSSNGTRDANSQYYWK
jgi:hypothetical protein